MLEAAATSSLTGRFSLQGRQAALGLQWWAAEAGIRLEIADDTGKPRVARDAYGRWIEKGVDILFGPYGSNLVRGIAPVVTAAGRLLWNHGGAADDLARSLVVPLPAPASTYLHGAVEMAADLGLEEVVIASGSGRFVEAVSDGAEEATSARGLGVTKVGMGALDSSLVSTRHAALVVGTFDEDIAVIRRLRRTEPGLIACVAAGLPEFGNRLGALAEGVVGPVQWLPQADISDIGPSAREFAQGFEASFGSPPSYVAAQAAAAGFLAAEAHRRGLEPPEVQRWQTTTLLGAFALDSAWRQVGHKVSTVIWKDRRQVPLSRL